MSNEKRRPMAAGKAKEKPLTRIFSLIRKHLGKTTPVVAFKSPFQVLISTVLSQRTRDENTEIASKRLFSRYPSPEKLASADLRSIERLIKPSGFYRVKARRVKAIAKEILSRFGGKTPGGIEELLSLKGVGRKTANCVLCYAFGKPAIAVDVHVHRIANRIGIVSTKGPEQTEEALAAILPKRAWLGVNELLVKFGRKTCRPIGPKCGECPLSAWCDYGIAHLAK